MPIKPVMKAAQQTMQSLVLFGTGLFVFSLYLALFQPPQRPVGLQKVEQASIYSESVEEKVNKHLYWTSKRQEIEASARAIEQRKMQLEQSRTPQSTQDQPGAGLWFCPLP